MDDEWLHLIPPAVVLIWISWSLLARQKRKKRKRQPVADRPNEPYSIYDRSYDRELKGRLAPSVLAESGCYTSVPKNTKIIDIKHRTSAAIEAYNRAKADAGCRALEVAGGLLLPDSAICLLIDQSGSMRDEIVELAGEVRAASETLTACGINLAVLGFTTLGWKGGPARQAWRRLGSPPYPGRLCALLHIEYQAFGEPLAYEDWQTMLDPHCLFENIDGEALSWAAEKLSKQDGSRRILVVVSDGAPVDDSTLSENGPSYLERHVMNTISDLQLRSDINLAAIGVNHDVARYYQKSFKIERADQFSNTLAELITQLQSAKASF